MCTTWLTQFIKNSAMWLNQIYPLTETDYSFNSSRFAVKFISSGDLYTSYHTTSHQQSKAAQSITQTNTK
jgi:hypothetical protein